MPGTGFKLPRWTLRLRLTLLYGALFLVTGAILLAITYGLVASSVSSTPGNQALVVKGRILGVPKVVTLPDVRGPVYFSDRLSPSSPPPPKQLPLALQRYSARLEAAARTQIVHQRSAQLDALLTESGIALGIMAVVSIGLGWLMAGRALRPVRTMNARVRGISERNLHERVALAGPDDELKELGDTFDALLGRLQTAFESQRRFVANASHELRTPITLERTLVEVALADPGASVEALRETCERVLSATEQQERLIEALLTLARGQRGLDERSGVDLGQVVAEVVRSVPAAGIVVRSQLGAAVIAGDRALMERMVANLVDNAVHHNRPQGWVEVWTGLRDGRPTVRVANSGPLIGADQVGGLLEPFRRLNGDPRTRHHRGLGLGLSIVEAIVAAHGGDLVLAPRAGGGLVVRASFAAVPGVFDGRPAAGSAEIAAAGLAERSRGIGGELGGPVLAPP